MSDRDLSQEILEETKRQINKARDEFMRQLNKQLYADAHVYVTSYTYVRPIRFKRLRRYLRNWREAIGAVGRAIIGRDAIPECPESDGY